MPLKVLNRVGCEVEEEQVVNGMPKEKAITDLEGTDGGFINLAISARTTHVCPLP
jgi:hypothetical protein